MAQLDDLSDRVAAVVTLEREAAAAGNHAREGWESLVGSIARALAPDETVRRLAETDSQALVCAVLDDIRFRVTREMGRRKGDVYPGDPGFPKEVAA